MLSATCAATSSAGAAERSFVVEEDAQGSGWCNIRVTAGQGEIRWRRGDGMAHRGVVPLAGVMTKNLAVGLCGQLSPWAGGVAGHLTLVPPLDEPKDGSEALEAVQAALKELDRKLGELARLHGQDRNSQEPEGRFTCTKRTTR
jgi:hypothetical protein